MNNSGSIRTIRFFRAGVNYFRDYPTTLAQQYEHNRGVTNKELRPLCYENLMAAIAEVMSKPNQVSAVRLVQADAGALIDGPGAGGAN
jgi:hypothetical protein